MAYGDNIPETAHDLVSNDDRCTCTYGDVLDPDDAEDAKIFMRAQRTKFGLIAFNPNCPWPAHRAGQHATWYTRNRVLP